MTRWLDLKIRLQKGKNEEKLKKLSANSAEDAANENLRNEQEGSSCRCRQGNSNPADDKSNHRFREWKGKVPTGSG